MSQPTHLTLALGRTRDDRRNDTTNAIPDLSMTATYRLDPGETDLTAVVEERAGGLRAAFAAFCANLYPQTAADTDEDDASDDALEEWQDEDAEEEQEDVNGER